VTILKDKIILITGGTGSFGNEMLRGALLQDCREIRVFSRDELKQEHMRINLRNRRVQFYVGDVRDRESVDHAMRGVDLVFHAAALKQVPSCEFFPMQAMLTNVVGSNNVIESAVANRVKSVVCLSTDKAVYPVNAMGMTKALMEKLAHAAARGRAMHDCVISCVRYGNVMCSRGSVIPLFIKQIKDRQPITMTEPGMTRFLLPLTNAIELVIFAFSNAHQGDTFIRKAPACTVLDLALALKNIFDSDVPLNTMGIRHGEKIYETLATVEELSNADDLGDYYRLRIDGRDLNYEKYSVEGELKHQHLMDYTSHNTYRLSVSEIEALLMKLPEVTREL
jgi:UDP-N-acetylglucosamine 4,6-dehydratase